MCIYKQLSKDSVDCTVHTVRSKGNSPSPKPNRKDKWLSMVLSACQNSCWSPGSQYHRSLIHFKIHDSILALLTSSTLNFPSAGASSHPQLLSLRISLLFQQCYLCPPSSFFTSPSISALPSLLSLF